MTDLKDKRDRCLICNTSVDDTVLYRTSPLGTVPANWTCLKCIRAQKTAEDLTTTDMSGL